MKHLRLVSIFLSVTGLLFTNSSVGQESESRIGVDGLSVELGYVSDLFSSRSGGIETGTRHLQNLNLTTTFDFSEMTGKEIGELFLSFLYNDKTTFSDVVGDLQVASNIDSDQGWRFYEAWWDVPLGEHLSVRTGLYDLNSEFDAIDTAGYFINSSQGIGADYAQTGENGPSIFPSTSAAIRLAWSNGATTLKYALLDAVPGDPDDPEAFVSIQLGDGEGVLHALELERTFDNGIRAAMGYWGYSADFEKVNEFAEGESETGDGNHGLYAFIDAPVYKSADTWINAFARYGVANETYNQLSSYLGFGAVVGGFLESRPDDILGIAVASAFNGDDFKQLNNGLVEGNETVIELTYSGQITQYLRVQPNIQYILNPGTDPSLGNALVAGIRFELVSAL